MKPIRIPLIAALTLCAAFAGSNSSRAATIALYSFTGNSLSVTTKDPGVTASDLTTVGFQNEGYNNSTTGSASGTPSRQANFMNDNFNVNSDYWSFTIDPGSNTIDITSFDFYYSRENTNSADQWILRSSLDGYAANIQTGGVPGTLAGVSNAMTFDTTTLNLTDIDEAITFRFYTYSAAASSRFLRVDDIRVQGTVTIPEPSSALLLGLGGLGLVLRRRRSA